MDAPPSRPPARVAWPTYFRALGSAHRKAKAELGGSMPLLQHLEELRRRVFMSFAAVVLATLASFAFVAPVVDFLATPVGGLEALVSIEITESFSVSMRVSLLCGAALSMPVIVYHVLRFVLPGLTPAEGRWLLLGAPFAGLLFFAGVAFTWFVLLPTAIPFLVGFLGITTQVRPQNYFRFITGLMFWIGLSFELPLVVLVLARLGLVRAGQLARYWRHAIVAIAVASAAITPTADPLNMTLVMLPLIVLYAVSIVVAAFAGRC